MKCTGREPEIGCSGVGAIAAILVACIVCVANGAPVLPALIVTASSCVAVYAVGVFAYVKSNK